MREESAFSVSRSLSRKTRESPQKTGEKKSVELRENRMPSLPDALQDRNPSTYAYTHRIRQSFWARPPCKCRNLNSVVLHARYSCPQSVNNYYQAGQTRGTSTSIRHGRSESWKTVPKLGAIRCERQRQTKTRSSATQHTITLILPRFDCLPCELVARPPLSVFVP